MPNWLGARQQVDSVATKSALSPGLWLTGIIAALLIPATPFLPIWAAIAGWVIFAIVALGTFCIFVHHSLKNPSLLRSEEYSLKAHAMEICGDGSRSASDLSRILSAPAISPQTYLEGRAAK